MVKSKIKKPWYLQWWAIVIYVLIGLSLISNIFTNLDTQFLKSQNYEVLDYGYNEVAKSSPTYNPDSGIRDFAYVEMKALGNREGQISNGWIFLGNKYKIASEYTVIILTESEECHYSIDGDIYRAHLFALSNYWSTDNPILMNKTDIEEKFDYTHWKNVLKSELTKLANNEETEEEYSLYDIEKMVNEYEKLNNTQVDRETIYQIYRYYLNNAYCD